jgi:predicted metal-dependent hydrolase
MAKIDYEIKSSGKAKYMRIAVYPDCKVIVTKPRRIPNVLAEEFVNRKSTWILRKLNFYKNREIKKFAPTRSKNKPEAFEFVNSRLKIFNQHYRFVIGKVSIKDLRSLWGSCSSRKNLNFNHKIVDLPPEQADYIIVHELCHLREFNHSKKFWDLVAETIPNFRRIKNELKNYSFY